MCHCWLCTKKRSSDQGHKCFYFIIFHLWTKYVSTAIAKQYEHKARIKQNSDLSDRSQSLNFLWDPLHTLKQLWEVEKVENTWRNPNLISKNADFLDLTQICNRPWDRPHTLKLPSEVKNVERTWRNPNLISKNADLSDATPAFNHIWDLKLSLTHETFLKLFLHF